MCGCLLGVSGMLLMLLYSEKLADRRIQKYKTENNIKDKHTAVFPTYEDKVEAIENDRIRKNSTKEERLKEIIKHTATTYKSIKEQHI